MAWGPWQILLVIVVLVLVFGSKKLPELARALGKAKGEFKKGTAEGEALLKEEEEIPPDDIEPPPMEEVEITVDTPNPNPVSNVTPVPSPPSSQVSVKPAPMDSVAIVKSPVTMKSMTGSRTPGSIGAATRGGAGYGSRPSRTPTAAGATGSTRLPIPLLPSSPISPTANTPAPHRPTSAISAQRCRWQLTT